MVGADGVGTGEGLARGGCRGLQWGRAWVAELIVGGGQWWDDGARRRVDRVVDVAGRGGKAVEVGRLCTREVGGVASLGWSGGSADSGVGTCGGDWAKSGDGWRRQWPMRRG
jgi:hypothetical protein